ncbi:hypothetical protein BC936DRAFT_139341, partial [Jimgerdemannia flammicorona]
MSMWTSQGSSPSHLSETGVGNDPSSLTSNDIFAVVYTLGHEKGDSAQPKNAFRLPCAPSLNTRGSPRSEVAVGLHQRLNLVRRVSVRRCLLRRNLQALNRKTDIQNEDNDYLYSLDISSGSSRSFSDPSPRRRRFMCMKRVIFWRLIETAG